MAFNPSSNCGFQSTNLHTFCSLTSSYVVFLHSKCVDVRYTKFTSHVEVEFLSISSIQFKFLNSNSNSIWKEIVHKSLQKVLKYACEYGGDFFLNSQKK